MRPIILKTGSTLPEIASRRGDFEHWIAEGFGWPLSRFEVIDAAVTTGYPTPGSVDGIIVTGSPARVPDREPWSVRAGTWLRDAVGAGVPTLGICYGHQLLGDALGATVAASPLGREIGICEVDLDNTDPLFEGLPPRVAFILTHLDAVLTLPEGARRLGHNAHTPVQAMAIGDHARSVQFHPEFDADIICAYIQARRAQIDAEREPGAAERIIATVRECPANQVIFDNFCRNFLHA